MQSGTLSIDLDTLAEKRVFTKKDIDNFATYDVHVTSDVYYVHVAYIAHTNGPMSDGAMLAMADIKGISTIIAYIRTPDDDDRHPSSKLVDAMKKIQNVDFFERCAFVVHCDTEDRRRANEILKYLYTEDAKLHHRTHLVTTHKGLINDWTIHLKSDLRYRSVHLWEWAFESSPVIWRRMTRHRFVDQMQKCTFGTRFPDDDTDMLELYRIYKFGRNLFYHKEEHAPFRRIIEMGATPTRSLQD